MCPMPTMPKLSLNTYIHIAVAIAFLAMLYVSKMLWNQNEVLTETNIKITTIYQEKVAALTSCSNGVIALKKRENEITENAKAAVAEAKKEAVVEYKASNAYLFKKPKAPVITSANVQDYGGNDTMIQLKDYLATQKLINDFIDEQAAK